MRSGALLLSLVLALGGGYFVYQSYFASSNLAKAPPQEQIDVTSIRGELLTIGAAERQYFATHSQYGSLDELQEDKLLAGAADRRGYVFSAAVDGDRGFTVTAAPGDPNKTGWPTLSIDQSMQVTQRQ
jgi:hypothetical protein